MIDLHTHTLLSDGVLLPSELARRAEVAGYKAIGMTDHVDHSNIDVVLAGITRVAKVLNKVWNIRVIPGVEITHAPLEVFPELVRYARKKGALIVVGHGQSPAEPVIKGTNRAAIEAGVDILAHPGNISPEDALLAAENGVYLEITSRRGHSFGNEHVFAEALKAGAEMVFNTDSHGPEDLMSEEKIQQIFGKLTGDARVKAKVLENSERLIKNLKI